jgi:transposase
MSNDKKSEKPRRPKRRFNEEYKADAVELVRRRRQQGLPAADVARELDINPSLLSKWLHDAEEANPRSDRGETLEEEVRRLRRENATLREERAFAKKAAAFFAMESR